MSSRTELLREKQEIIKQIDDLKAKVKLLEREIRLCKRLCGQCSLNGIEIPALSGNWLCRKCTDEIE